MLKKILAAAALVAASSGAVAAEAPGLYAGIDVGSTRLDGYKRDEGIGAFIGYKFSERIAIEAGYHGLVDSGWDFGLSGGVTINQTAVSVLGTLPLSSGFSVYGRLGWNRLEAERDFAGFEDSISETKILYGIGLGYRFTPSFNARVEVQKPASNITRTALGVAYHF